MAESPYTRCLRCGAEVLVRVWGNATKGQAAHWRMLDARLTSVLGIPHTCPVIARSEQHAEG